ncbi:uncharacterized protein EI97DRAFT_146617 [Westerdykella ornata]|uniref:Uncharacterized protein n=1 Tax=Westerdykella ornata TaxID=318751 RepID=A0A6A6JCG0_WESOR|nr:uncharacterized protein EI97DRAFT_146617 [Westerdykella ornata]KAF2273863.1 hypothetical protein EI97DRAFT_146617 [Westerdykella ornata]
MLSFTFVLSLATRCWVLAVGFHFLNGVCGISPLGKTCIPSFWNFCLSILILSHAVCPLLLIILAHHSTCLYSLVFGEQRLRHTSACTCEGSSSIHCRQRSTWDRLRTPESLNFHSMSFPSSETRPHSHPSTAREQPVRLGRGFLYRSRRRRGGEIYLNNTGRNPTRRQHALAAEKEAKKARCRHENLHKSSSMCGRKFQWHEE